MSPIRNPLGTVLAALTIAGLSAALVVSPVKAHTDFVGSDPVGGALLEEAPREVRLEFSEGMDAGLSAVNVQVGDGEAARLEVRDGATRNALVASVPSSLLPDAGTTTSWKVTFRVVSGDGHPVTGSFEFDVRTREDAQPAGRGAAEGGSGVGTQTTEPLGRRTLERRGTWPLAVLGAGVLVLIALAVATTMRLVRRNPRA